MALYIYQGIGAYYKFIIEYMLKGQCHLMYQTFVLIKLMIFNFLIACCIAILPQNQPKLKPFLFMKYISNYTTFWQLNRPTVYCISFVHVLDFKMFGDICRGWEPYIIVEVSLSHNMS